MIIFELVNIDFTDEEPDKIAAMGYRKRETMHSALQANREAPSRPIGKHFGVCWVHVLAPAWPYFAMSLPLRVLQLV